MAVLPLKASAEILLPASSGGRWLWRARLGAAPLQSLPLSVRFLHVCVLLSASHPTPLCYRTHVIAFSAPSDNAG